MTAARRATRPATKLADGENLAPTAAPLIPLRTPREGVPEVIDSHIDLDAYADALADGSGPVAVDAERASSYRYGQSAYLVQVRRAGAGTALIDPQALDGDLGVLDDALAGVEWVLHAADQDLPCLREVGMEPDALFDTELAARLLGRPRVGLGPLVADLLGYDLAKEHSVADWSRRPLPQDWLAYAALDVELLTDLRGLLAGELREEGKAEWARQEFEHVRTAPPKPAPTDPWRKLPHLSSRVKTPRGLAVARAMWEARDELAQRLDRTPTHVLPSASIVAAAEHLPKTQQELAALPEFRGRGATSRLPYWFGAVAEGLAVPKDKLPPRRPERNDPGAEPRAHRTWRQIKPIAAARLEGVHGVVRPMAAKLRVPQENLLQPAAQRTLAWQGAGEGVVDLDDVTHSLRNLHARPWQIDLVAEGLTQALNAVEDGSVPIPEEVPSPRRAPSRSARRA